MRYFGQASRGALLLFGGGINEHLFFDTSNSISRLVSGGLLPNNPALALLWLLIPISGLSHGVIATVLFYPFHISSLIHRDLGQEERGGTGKSHGP